MEILIKSPIIRSRRAFLSIASLFLLVFSIGGVAAFEVRASLSGSETVRAGSEGGEPLPTATPTPEGARKQTPVDEELTLDQLMDDSFGSPDADCDGLRNIQDNCPLVYNPDQKNNDGDSYGDVCDADIGNEKRIDRRCDTDGDGVFDHVDNCPRACNPDQRDKNDNGMGDICEALKERLESIPCKKPRAPKPGLRVPEL